MKFYTIISTFCLFLTPFLTYGAADSEYAFGGGYTYFNDQSSKSVKPGNGFSIKIQNGNGRASYIGFVSNLEFIMSGKNHGDFIDKNLNRIEDVYFDLYLINYALGMRISTYPDSPILPYVGFSGVISIASFQFKNKTSEDFSEQQRGLMYGYDIFVGIDFYLSGNKDNGWGLRAEGNMTSLFAVQKFDCGRPQIHTLNGSLMLVTTF
jgi:hypothetical protein